MIWKKKSKSSTLRPVEGSKEFVVKYIWYNDSNQKCGDYGLYEGAMKSDIITFTKGKIKDDAID